MLAHGLEVGEPACLAQYLAHHGLCALLVENAPQRRRVHGPHRIHHGRVGQHTGSDSIPGVQGLLHGVGTAKDHG